MFPRIAVGREKGTGYLIGTSSSVALRLDGASLPLPGHTRGQVLLSHTQKLLGYAAEAALIIAVFMTGSGCEWFDRTAPPIGYSKDGNGRNCSTYETKSKGVYETVCDYGGQYPASVTNPLTKHE